MDRSMLNPPMRDRVRNEEIMKRNGVKEII